MVAEQVWFVQNTVRGLKEVAATGKLKLTQGHYINMKTYFS